MGLSNKNAARMASGITIQQSAVMPPFPLFQELCPRLTKIAPDEAKQYDNAVKSWVDQVNQNIQAGFKAANQGGA